MSPAEAEWVADARAAARRVAEAAAADDAADGGAAALTVLTWNVQLLAVSVGTPAQLAARAAKQAARILELSPDVVCLQEVFDARARAVLLAALAPAYAAVFAPADAARCGLVIAARGGLKLQGTAFHRFAGARGAEAWLFDKGAAGALLVMPPRGAHAASECGCGSGETSGDGDCDATPAASADGGASASRRASCVVIVNTHTQSDYWAPGERARAAQALELRAFFGRMCASAAASGLDVRGALVLGDLNCAAGSPEAAAMLTALRAPHTRDLAEPAEAGAACDDASFPLGAWKPKLAAYALSVPTARLDYILDASAAARADRKPLRRAEAAVERRIAQDDDTALLSDHAAVVATVALPR